MEVQQNAFRLAAFVPKYINFKCELAMIKNAYEDVLNSSDKTTLLQRSLPF